MTVNVALHAAPVALSDLRRPGSAPPGTAEAIESAISRYNGAHPDAPLDIPDDRSQLRLEHLPPELAQELIGIVPGDQAAVQNEDGTVSLHHLAGQSDLMDVSTNDLAAFDVTGIAFTEGMPEEMPAQPSRPAPADGTRPTPAENRWLREGPHPDVRDTRGQPLFAPVEEMSTDYRRPEMAIAREEVLEAVGDRAKELAIDGLDEAIAHFQNLAGDPVAALDWLVGLYRQTPAHQRESTLRAVLGLDAGLLNPYEASNTLNHVLLDLEAIAAGGDDGQARAQRFLSVPSYSVRETVMDAVAFQARAMGEMKREIAGMSDLAASYQICRDMPALRDQLYGEFGFQRLDRQQFPPLERDLLARVGVNDDIDHFAEIGAFTSNGEWLFADSMAQAQSDSSLVEGIANLAVIATSIACPPAGIALGLGQNAMAIVDSNEELDRMQTLLAADLTTVEHVEGAEQDRTTAYLNTAVSLGSGSLDALEMASGIDVGTATSVTRAMGTTLANPATHGDGSAQDVAAGLTEAVLAGVTGTIPTETNLGRAGSLIVQAGQGAVVDVVSDAVPEGQESPPARKTAPPTDKLDVTR